MLVFLHQSIVIPFSPALEVRRDGAAHHDGGSRLWSTNERACGPPSPGLNRILSRTASICILIIKVAIVVASFADSAARSARAKELAANLASIFWGTDDHFGRKLGALRHSFDILPFGPIIGIILVF